MIIGIDPGNHGGLAAIQENTLEIKLLEKFKNSPIDNVILLQTTLKKFNGEHLIVFCEKGNAYPRQGAVSTFTFGFNNGLIFGALAGKVEWHWVRPVEWQRYFKISSAKKKGQAKHIRRNFIKKQSLQKAKELYPLYADIIKNHDGLSDALLIARYGVWKILNK